MRAFLFVIKFFLIGAFFIVGNYNLPLVEDGNLQQFGALYIDWLWDVTGNVASLTTYVVKVEWLPEVIENSTLNLDDRKR